MSTAVATVPSVTDPRELALLKAVGFDRLNTEQRELALNIATRYELDVMLKHLVMIEGRPYITRDGLLHIAHRSGKLDGIETSTPVLADGYWRATCSVYRKDMTRPFTYAGRYPAQGGNAKYAPEMAVKVAESMSLRRAFDIAAPTADERWDAPTEAPVPTAPRPTPTLVERVAEKAAEVAEPEPPKDSDAAEDIIAAANDQEFVSLTSDGFAAFLEAQRIAPAYAKAEAEFLFPGVKKLDDLQRAQLANALMAPATE